ncbi:MAG: MFS transporter [Myxococcales bacterium]|nr:MAG: MFS transporter [Myxococcales bacterium]
MPITILFFWLSASAASTAEFAFCGGRDTLAAPGSADEATPADPRPGRNRMSNASAERAMTNFQRFAYAVGNFGVGLLPSIIASWAMYYYAPGEEDRSCLIAYVPMSLIGVMLAVGRVAEALLNPFIGDWSDKTVSRWGRRIPYIIIGTPIMVLAMILIWFPPVRGESLVNAAWVCFWMTVLSCAFAAVVAPYLSLLPELTPYNGERLLLSSLMALFEVLGVLVAAAGAGLLIGAYKCGVFGFGAQEFNGFMLAGIIFGLASLVAFWITGFAIREKPYTPAKQVTFAFAAGAKEVMKNDAFRPYLALVTFFRIGIDMVVVVIPYMATIVMGGTENDAAIAQIIVLVGAVALFPLVNKLSLTHGKKRVTLWGVFGFVAILPLMFLIDKIPGLSPMAFGYIIFALATFPVAVFNVLPRPLLADIIDNDETITGMRREAMYNGMEGLFTRSASGFAWVLSSALFAAFGYSSSQPLGILLVGPVGGALLFVGAWLFRKYPFRT